MKFKNSIKNKLIFIQVLSLSTILAITLIAIVTAVTLSIFRSYVDGEGNWSKARLQSSRSLENYIRLGDLNYYQNFLHEIQPVQSYNRALEELLSPKTNFQLTKDLIVAGGSYEGEALLMGRLLKPSMRLPYIREAVKSWQEAIVSFNTMVQFAKQIRSQTELKKLSRNEIKSALVTLNNLDQSMRKHEKEFSFHISMASRKVAVTSIVGISLIGLTMFFVMWALTARGYSHIHMGLQNVLMSAELIAKGNLTHRVKLYRNDEIGHLAQAISKMAEQLEKKIHRIQFAL